MFHIGTATGLAKPALAERDDQRTRRSMTRNLKKGKKGTKTPKASKKSKKAPKKQKKGKKHYQPFTSKTDLEDEVGKWTNTDPAAYNTTKYGYVS